MVRDSILVRNSKIAAGSAGASGGGSPATCQSPDSNFETEVRTPRASRRASESETFFKLARLATDSAIDSIRVAVLPPGAAMVRPEILIIGSNPMKSPSISPMVTLASRLLLRPFSNVGLSPEIPPRIMRPTLT